MLFFLCVIDVVILFVVVLLVADHRRHRAASLPTAPPEPPSNDPAPPLSLDLLDTRYLERHRELQSELLRELLPIEKKNLERTDEVKSLLLDVRQQLVQRCSAIASRTEQFDALRELSTHLTTTLSCPAPSSEPRRPSNDLAPLEQSISALREQLTRVLSAPVSWGVVLCGTAANGSAAVFVPFSKTSAPGTVEVHSLVVPQPVLENALLFTWGSARLQAVQLNDRRALDVRSPVHVFSTPLPHQQKVVFQIAIL